VKPYVKGNKNDFNDAAAIAEAAGRASMPYVPLKTTEQLELQALHRVRRRFIVERTAVINQMRALLLEHGMTVPVGHHPGCPRIAARSLLPSEARFEAIIRSKWNRLSLTRHPSSTV
jgi:transposase